MWTLKATGKKKRGPVPSAIFSEWGGGWGGGGGGGWGWGGGVWGGGGGVTKRLRGSLCQVSIA